MSQRFVGSRWRGIRRPGRRPRRLRRPDRGLQSRLHRRTRRHRNGRHRRCRRHVLHRRPQRTAHRRCHRACRFALHEIIDYAIGEITAIVTDKIEAKILGKIEDVFTDHLDTGGSEDLSDYTVGSADMAQDLAIEFDDFDRATGGYQETRDNFDKKKSTHKTGAPNAAAR
ncbi:hypothetical protein ACFRMN_05750 [Streptomyces sp. NPDC056835]|uniref:hypothetical protein n=1 Tax=Streptomyces sp. NPDC056835 TaxID=3345956 RepID=UPI0036D184F4